MTAPNDCHHCWPFDLWGADLCSPLRATAGRKLQEISDDLFCHNKGIKKCTENLQPIVGEGCGGRAIVLVEITVPRHWAGPYCLKEDPLRTPTELKAASSFFTVVGWAGVPATLHARSASFIFHKPGTCFLLLGGERMAKKKPWDCCKTQSLNH